jgi:dipeptidyl aminopeptidase/acylaminoacyl peptidase
VIGVDAGAGQAHDRLAPPWSARTRVHEYGGGAWWLGAEHLYFSAWSDQRLYRLALDAAPDSEPQPLTPEPTEPAGLRYADGAEHPDRTWLVSVRERHQSELDGDSDASEEPTNELVAVAADGSEATEVLRAEADFVSDPRFSPDGAYLSWVEWNHPSMPWDDTRILVAPVTGPNEIGTPTVVAGAEAGSDPESAIGPDWTSDGTLVFSSDRSGWWNLYQWRPGTAEPTAVTGIEGAEIGHPPWQFGLGRRWSELADGRLAVAVTTDAVDALAVVNRPAIGSDPGSTASAPAVPIPVPVPAGRLVSIDGLAAIGDGRVALVATGATEMSAVLAVDVDTGAIEVLRAPEETGVDPAWFSEGQAVSFASGPAAEPRTAHAFYYPPNGPGIVGPAGELPPLVVMGHGGPTSHSNPGLRFKVQYWTSRGFAVVDVNYGGSTGYGRRYKDLLQGTWGVVDVEDCIAAAQSLADRGLADPDRLAIRGGSAGGFTVLAALEQSDIFGAGTNLFGVADLTALAADTHKFESRYLDGLIGPYPEQAELYRERSPLTHADDLSSPLLVMQGLEDEVVPPNQSEAIVAAVAAKGLPHAYVTFAGEQHGFRQAANIVRSFEVELWFYGRVFGFEPADEIAAPDGAVGL